MLAVYYSKLNEVTYMYTCLLLRAKHRISLLKVQFDSNIINNGLILPHNDITISIYVLFGGDLFPKNMYNFNDNLSWLLFVFFTGHEACFVAFLCCLFKLRVLDQSDYVSVVFKVFERQVTCQLQILFNN